MRKREGIKGKTVRLERSGGKEEKIMPKEENGREKDKTKEELKWEGGNRMRKAK